MLSLELCRYSSDIFLSSRPHHAGLATTYITGGMVEAQSVNVRNTTTSTSISIILETSFVDTRI